MKLTIYLFLFLTTAHSALAQNILNEKGVIVSAKALNVNSQEDLFSHQAEMRVVPASLTKIITTATALELLGSNYTFQTNFLYHGYIKNGILYGDIIVKTSGDATLGSKYFESTKPYVLFERISNSIKKLGVNQIQGEIIIQGQKVNYPSSRLWEDMGNYYGGSPKAFNWRDNTAIVTLKSSEVGQLCEIVSVVPEINPYTLQSQVIAASHTKDSAYVYGTSEIVNWWIEGSIPANRQSFKIKAALPNPSQAFKTELKDYLQSEGILVKNNNLPSGNKEGVLFYTYSSPPLSEIIKLINHKSNNLFADHLFLTLAKRFKNEANWDDGARIVKEFWQDKIEFEHHFRLRDGSGLSPKNLISAEGMVQLLSWMDNHSKYIDVFKASLAQGGKSGTLKTVFKDSRITGKVIGKSGSMEGVLGYCGYYLSQDNQIVAFCLVANNYLIPTKEMRKSIDKLITGWVLEN